MKPHKELGWVSGFVCLFVCLLVCLFFLRHVKYEGVYLSLITQLVVYYKLSSTFKTLFILKPYNPLQGVK